ncbi:hypothetical protein ADUPG1_001159 [Aduncisulcus paluster]|uniref:Uncharacterized protein n=1 Tax=Aduncisulcus paluster TaxID=2918883 RepID=A0ABQ5K9X2_9EUKA|nr:hypothetical protein ADUPG1_001159 [Aduncisulcus paluster]
MFTAGIRSTQRIEKEHAIEKRLGPRRHVKELIQSFTNRNIDRFTKTYDMEKKRSSSYTKVASDRLLKKAEKGEEKSSKCDDFCLILRCSGLSCPHGKLGAIPESSSGRFSFFAKLASLTAVRDFLFYMVFLLNVMRIHTLIYRRLRQYF